MARILTPRPPLPRGSVRRSDCNLGVNRWYSGRFFDFLHFQDSIEQNRSSLKLDSHASVLGRLLDDEGEAFAWTSFKIDFNWRDRRVLTRY